MLLRGTVWRAAVYPTTTTRSQCRNRTAVTRIASPFRTSRSARTLRRNRVHVYVTFLLKKRRPAHARQKHVTSFVGRSCSKFNWIFALGREGQAWKRLLHLVWSGQAPRIAEKTSTRAEVDTSHTKEKRNTRHSIKFLIRKKNRH